MAGFRLTLVTPERVIENETVVDDLIVPGHVGELNILPGHSPLITTLDIGQVKYKPEGSSEYKRVVTSWGYCEVYPDGVHILAETAETAEDIDKSRAQEAMKAAEKKLEQGELTPDEILKYQRKIKRANERLSL